MNPLVRNFARGSHWRSYSALLIILCAITAFLSGVSVSEKPATDQSDLLTLLYYCMSLFVVGGVDLGTPTGGPAWARAMLWFAYFSAPALAAWTLLGTLLSAISPQRWQLRRMKDHIIILGANELSLSYLRVLRRHNKKIPVIVIVKNLEPAAEDELVQGFGAMVVVGDITHEYLVRRLRPEHAKKIMLLGHDSLRGYEAATVLTNLYPGIGERIVLHCVSLRFMRAVASTRVAKECQTFNTYHLASAGLVKNHLLAHFADTEPQDTVVIAGFGRFGQTVLEELQKHALQEISSVIIIDMDAQRRVLIADEQMQFVRGYRRELLNGDISNPEIWDQVRGLVELNSPATVVVLGTGAEAHNLRAALWMREEFPKASIIARCSRDSMFAREVGEEHDLFSVSISQLLEDNIPPDWIAT